ncbi:chitinase-3-like protein 2 isoform X2 [Centruroides vittatus]
MNLFRRELLLSFINAFLMLSASLQLEDSEDLSHIRNRSRKVFDGIYKGILREENYSFPLHLTGSKEAAHKSSKKLVCYYVLENEKNNSLLPSDIDPTLCTHILIGFASVVDSCVVPSKPSDIKGYEWTVSLKRKNPKLKVMLSAGGGSEFSNAVSSSHNRTKFINSILKLLNRFHFDGVDIDWEFPAWSGSPAMDRINFVKFLREFNYASGHKYLLSVAVAAPKTIIDVSYDVPKIARYVDFVNLMSYDYHDYSQYLPFTGHNSPLFRRSIERGYFATLNTAWSAQYWLEKGLPRSKLLVGIPTYTHSYKLAVPYMHGFDAPAVGTGLGELTYPEVCNFLKEGGIRVFDKESQVPYTYKNLNWIGYDDYQSVSAKAHWIMKMDFGGAMTYDLNYDDWKGSCDGKTKFPLHRIIRSILCDKKAN